MSKQKHILVVSQYFYPEPFRINDICTEWVKRGYKVTVLTGIPNYPEGEYYDGYDLNHKRTDEWNGIKIIRIPLTARGHSSIRLIVNYGSFVVSGFLWKCLTKIKADLVFTFEVSPMTQALIGVWYAKKYKVPHYLYVQDLWPENVEIVTGIHSQAVLTPIRKMVDYIYENSDHIFATSPSFVKEIQKRCADKGKVSYWPQYAEDFYQPCERKPVPEIPEDDSFKVIFTGNIGTAQGLEILPAAAQLLKKENVKFVIVGDGRYQKEFEQEITDGGVADKFIMIPRQPAERIPELLAACDVAFISFMDTKLFEMTIPAKLQSYMACGKAIVAAAGGETERVIEEAECGVCSPIGDVEKLSEMIKKLQRTDKEKVTQMGIKSQRYCEIYFNKKQLMDDMDQFLHESWLCQRLKNARK